MHRLGPRRDQAGVTFEPVNVRSPARTAVVRSIQVFLRSDDPTKGWRKTKPRSRDEERERKGERDEGSSGSRVLRRTIKPCRLRGGVMGSPKVNLTAYDLLYLPPPHARVPCRATSPCSPRFNAVLPPPSPPVPPFFRSAVGDLAISMVVSRRVPPIVDGCRYG